ncbi:NACHT domain-containing protein [Microseira sp. BLCC-F43]|jgi:acid stress-induced BolA-like protein IbaG/YrbA|uniref:NACHT domain-containing protein n=1 Tax=Microseira sp. BLCC-F43 TaxID=3153602 RepID=UPI0035BB7D85
MAAADSTDFQADLESICSDEKYLGWQDFYTPTDALHGQPMEKKQPPRRLNLSLIVQTIPSPEEKAETEKVQRLEVLEGLRKYAENHVLLVGKPGSGKSTAPERLLWEEAEKAKTQPQGKIPVLVQLQPYKTSVLRIIGDFLFQHRCRLNEAEIEQLLLAGRFLLLVDGWNELPDEEARKDVKIFREKYQRVTPMIFTTRDLAGDIGIVNNIGTQHNYALKQNLAESAAEIQQLLEQLAKNNQTIVQSDNQAVVVSAIHEEIKRNPTIKARLLNALKAGGTEALKQAFRCNL